MTVIRWAGFAGENRAIHPRLLAENLGTLSQNQKPGRGDLRPWKLPTQVASVPAGSKTIYRMGRDVASDANYWLSWPTVVHAVRGFDVDDTTERTYFTGSGAPKVTSNTMALASLPYPTTSRPMGLPAPATPPTAQADAGTWTGLAQTVFYAYTYVNDWGWESAPSPASAMLETFSDATATISGFAPPPSGNYGIDRIRIYRTQTGSASTEFYFLREVTVGAASTQDDGRDLGEVMPTTTWLTPPDDLSFLTGLWNGMLAGVSGSSVRFCEAYTPYAWPIAYDVVPPDSKPVGLGVFGQQLLVLTTGRPMLVAGSSPESMDQMPLEFAQACVAARSIVSMGSGVAWASEDGLCWYGSGGARILTAGIMLREDWQKLKPATIIGKMYEGLYFGSYDDGAGRKGFVINPGDQGGGIYFLSAGYEALHFDELQDQLYVLDGTNVKRWDAGDLMTVKARSKEYRLPRPANLSAAEVVADTYPVTFRLYADGELKHTQTVAGANPFRLPSGFLAQSYQLEIEGTSPVQAVAMASSIKELSEV